MTGYQTLTLPLSQQKKKWEMKIKEEKEERNNKEEVKMNNDIGTYYVYLPERGRKSTALRSLESLKH